MKPGPAGLGLAREPEPPAPAAEARGRDKGEADAERRRTRERQEATLAGLAELEYLRQRQELLVRGALRGAGPPGAAARGAAEPLPGGDPGPRGRLEEKFLEENILLLRKQLNCLRRRDAGLLNQLQELDKQISDLRLDVEKTSEEHLETDSRPSSGFYELSDGASGSLSNSSNSVFSECLSSCHSSTCFCSPLEANLSITDGCPKSSDVNPKYQCDLVSKNGNDVYRYPSPLHAVAVQSPMFLLCLSGNTLREEEKLDNHVGDLCLGSELDTIKTDTSLPSPSALWSHPSSTKKMDGYILSLVQKKTHPVRTNKPRTSVNADPTKGLLRNGSVCVRVAGALPQSNHGNPKNCKQVGSTGGTLALDPGTFATLRPWAKDSKPELLETHKRLPGLEGPSTINVAVAATDLPSKHLPRSIKPLSQDQGRCPPSAPMSMPVPVPMPMPGESPHENTQVAGAASFCKDSPGRGTVLDSKVGVQAPKKSPPRSSSSLLSASPATVLPAGTPSMLLSPPAVMLEERPGLDFKSEGSSSQSLEEGALVKAQFVPGQPPNSRPHRGAGGGCGSGSGSSSNSSTSRPAASRPRAPLGLHPGHPDNPSSLLLPPVREKTRAGSGPGPGPGKKCRFPDDQDSNRRPRRGASKGRRSQAEAQLPPGRLLGAHSRAGSRGHGHGHGQGQGQVQGHGHGHARDPVVLVAKPKHKRTEAAFEEALRRARRARRDPHAGLYPARPYASPYAHARARTRVHTRARAPRASDSEYSAECESLFHSTVLDTSDDERSDFTANRFGDSESSASDDDPDAHGHGHGRGGSSGGDSSSDSDSGDEDEDEDEGPGGLGWARFVRGASGPEQLPRHGHGRGHAAAATGAPATKAAATTGRAVVKIKASHTLKKKILRFRSGSLKLMTTV